MSPAQDPMIAYYKNVEILHRMSAQIHKDLFEGPRNNPDDSYFKPSDDFFYNENVYQETPNSTRSTGGNEFLYDDPRREISLADEDMYLEKWLESFPAIEGWADDLQGRSSELETLAWYQSVSEHGLNAGIYIRDIGIAHYAKNILRNVKLDTLYPVRSAINAAIAALLAHEVFHHNVENFALRVGVTFDQEFYLNYMHTAYLPARIPVLSDDLLEEALASANEVINFSKASPNGANASKLNQTKIRQYLRHTMMSRPPGYRQGDQFCTADFFKWGNYELAALIVRNSKAYRGPLEHIWPKPLDIGKGALADHFTRHWHFVTSGQYAPPPPFVI